MLTAVREDRPHRFPDTPVFFREYSYVRVYEDAIILMRF